MKPETSSVRPPRLAAWLISLFTPSSDDVILGDLHEEFSQLTQKLGTRRARNWYWRQTLRTIAHLFCAGFRAAPWSTAAVIVGGYYLMKLAFHLPEQAISAIFTSHQLYERHFEAYRFWISDGIVLGLIVENSFVGAIVAGVAKGREMPATITLGVYKIVSVLTLILVGGAITGDWSHSPLLHTFAFGIATIVGGAVVRTFRTHPFRLATSNGKLP